MNPRNRSLLLRQQGDSVSFSIRSFSSAHMLTENRQGLAEESDSGRHAWPGPNTPGHCQRRHLPAVTRGYPRHAAVTPTEHRAAGPGTTHRRLWARSRRGRHHRPSATRPRAALRGREPLTGSVGHERSRAAPAGPRRDTPAGAGSAQRARAVRSARGARGALTGLLPPGPPGQRSARCRRGPRALAGRFPATGAVLPAGTRSRLPGP